MFAPPRKHETVPAFPTVFPTSFPSSEGRPARFKIDMHFSVGVVSAFAVWIVLLGREAFELGHGKVMEFEKSWLDHLPFPFDVDGSFLEVVGNRRCALRNTF